MISTISVVTGHPTICIDAKLLRSLKHLGYGCATNAWINYFQMGKSTGCLCVERFCKTIAQITALHEQYLQPYTSADMQCISELHEHVHGVPGMLGSLDCMHVNWKNCPIAYQRSYLGKEKYAMIVWEVVAGNSLWFWHAVLGFAGSCNDINSLDISPLQIDFVYSIGEFEFNKIFYLGDGIYTQLT